MTIRHIRIFLEVCRTMNVTRAAENLYMTQPAVSRSIHEIEQVYGVRLFERLNQRLYLTDSGRRMRAYAVHIVDTFDQMERELSDGDERGMLRIGASITLGNYELPGVVRRMKQERPSLRLQATVANVDTLKEMLLDNRLDLAMIEAPIEHRDLTGEPFSRDELVLILPPNHALLQKDRLTLADVAACDLLLREKGSSGRAFLDTVFEAHDLSVSPLWESASTEALVRAVAAGIGLSILPERLVRRALASGAVLTFLGRFLIGTWSIRTAFWVLGLLMLAVCGAGAAILENPEQPPRETAKQKRGGGPAPKRPRDYSVKEMLKTNQYWLMFAVVGLATPAVLLFSPIIVELAQERGLSQTAALACIVVGSVFSAAGRLLMPWLSDKIGRRYTDMLLLAALCGFSVWFIYAGSWWVILVYSLLTFCYSGEAAVIPAAGTDLFGQKNAGINYGFLALGMSVGSVGFPLLARCFEGEAVRHFIAIAATAAGFVCLWFLKPTQGERL